MILAKKFTSKIIAKINVYKIYIYTFLLYFFFQSISRTLIITIKPTKFHCLLPRKCINKVFKT